jgi:hypothetical protein
MKGVEDSMRNEKYNVSLSIDDIIVLSNIRYCISDKDLKKKASILISRIIEQYKEQKNEK